jgi:hypothetical protein
MGKDNDALNKFLRILLKRGKVVKFKKLFDFFRPAIYNSAE